MRFRSVATVPIHFEMDGTVYQVPVGGECEIPDAKAFAIGPMGLPLVAVQADPAPAPPALKAEPKTDKKPAPKADAPKPDASK